MDVKTSGQCSQVAKQNLINREGGPSITCNWARFVFLHYEVEPALLQPDIPYALHLFEHKAYISLVAFTMEQFRFSKGGVFAKWLTAPIPTHQYFNIRTYVQHGGDNGIYFINEWISHLLCSITGSIMYGLPCHYGKLHYQYDDHLRQFSGRLIPANMRGAYDYQAEGDPQKQCEHVKKDSLDEFLLERYIAFVKSYHKKKYFRIWHKPWLQAPLDIKNVNDALLPRIGAWGNALKLIKGHYSPGVYGVWMGKSQLVS